ncbi:MAG: glycerol-3-phosphate dehydrogenase/oxidase [Nitrospirota bacterium]
MSEALFDVIVIGGGITGAGVARDASQRGLSTLLLEKRDYASGVSSKTTRLVHGGLRYLANFEIDLVAEALRERSILRKQCPYLITPMPIMIPIYQGDPHGRAAISIGIHLYELLTREQDIPHYFTSGTDRTLSMEPRLGRDGLKGSALFYDHQIIMPERLVLENIIAARETGATVLNYTAAEKIEDHGDRVMVTARDAISGMVSTYQARVVINAGGPWVDQVRASGGIDRTKIIYPTKGIHLILPKISEQSLFVASKDGRMFFIIPMDRWSLIGTTDTRYSGDLDEVHADAADVEYLLTESRRVLPGLNLTRESILYTYAGVRPLAFAGEKESTISRKHRVIPEGRSGRVITIAGGKYTTYRNMAEDVVDAACKRLGRKAVCETARSPLAGSLPAPLEEYVKEAVPRMSETFSVTSDTVRHLIHLYGSRAEKVLQFAKDDPRLAEPVCTESRDIYAQVLYGIREEGARNLSDIVLRRMHTGITTSRGEAQAARIAEIAAQALHWSSDEQDDWIERFSDDLRKERMF